MKVTSVRTSARGSHRRSRAKIHRALFAATLVYLLTITVVSAAGWTLVFHDEFDGTKLDRTKWATRFAYSNETLDYLSQNGEEQRYRDNDNHVIEDGVLNLVARISSEKDHKYDSGLIRSFATFYFGYFEARVRQPPGRGTWPAFWLTADQDASGDFFWPPEIDIFDNANNGRDDDSSTIHSGVVPVPGSDKSGDYIRKADGFDSRWHSIRIPGSLTEEYHVYGLLWGPETVTVFVDGKELYSRHYAWVNTSGQRPGPAHILLNLAIGGPWAGRYGIDESAFPQSLQIDYVRVCRLDSSASASRRSCGDSQFTPSPESALPVFSGQGPTDLLRTKIASSMIETQRTSGGRVLNIRTDLTGGEPSRAPLKAFFYIFGPHQDLLQVQQLLLPVSATEWSGKTFQLAAQMKLPLTAAKGSYEVYLAIGRTEEWDREGRHWLKPITLEYENGVASQKRAAQPLRYLLGTVSID